MFGSMLSFALFALPLVSCKGGKGGGGGGGSSGGGGSGTNQISYSVYECYTMFLGPVEANGNGSDGRSAGPDLGTGRPLYRWIWDDGHKNNSVNYLTTTVPTTNYQMEVLDAYYNGSFSLTLTPPQANSTFDCPQLKSQTIPNMFLRLGPQSNRDVDRKKYGDENPYYFHFGRSIFDRNCPQTANKAFVNFESSNDNLMSSQAWTLTQKKNGDNFDLTGSLTSNVANFNNYFNYVVNATGPDAPYPVKCPRVFSMRAMLANTGAKMTATVSAKEAKMDFEFTDSKLQWKITGTFTGQVWDKGPKIQFDKEAIQTTGEVPHVKPHPPEKKGGATMDGWLKYIVIGVAVVVGLFILYLIWKFFTCLFACIQCIFCCKRKSKKAEYGNKSPHGDVEQHAGVYDKQPAAYVMPVATPTPAPQYSAANEISYNVSPAVAESFTVTGGIGYAEISAAQEDLHKQQVDLHNARLRGDADAIAYADSMVGYQTRVIEHWMNVRKGF